MIKCALVIGSGTIGLACAPLLACRGWEVHLLVSASQTSLTLLLNHVTRSLIQDIWRFDNSYGVSSTSSINVIFAAGHRMP